MGFRAQTPSVPSVLIRPGGPFAQMCELLADLLGRQDAPDGSPDGVWIAFAVPPLGVFHGRRGVGLVPLLTMVRNPLLTHLLHRGRRFADPAALGTYLFGSVLVVEASASGQRAVAASWYPGIARPSPRPP